MSYSWMITINDIQDESIIKLGDTWLQAHPSASPCYYDLTAQRMISFANTFGIDVGTLNAFNRTNTPPHDNLIQWMILCIQMLVAKNLVGLNNDPVVDDKWRFKYQTNSSELKSVSKNITYEQFLTATMQQNYTRAAGTGVLITC